MAKMKPGDPAYWMLFDGVESTPVVHHPNCYICNDPEFAQMGLPLCRKCPACGGHIPADDSVCDSCGYDEYQGGPILTINDDWHDYNLWLERRGLHDEAPGWLTATWEFLGHADGEEVWLELD